MPWITLSRWSLLAALSVVLQLPGDSGQNIGSSGYTSVQAQSKHFALVDPVRLMEKLRERMFTLSHQRDHPVPAGKALQLSIFARD